MKFEMLSEKDIKKIHSASLQVLEKTGGQIHNEAAKELLSNAGCDICDNNLVKIPGDLVEQCLDSVAKGFTLYDRQGNVACELKGRNSYFGTGVTNPNFHDYKTGQRKHLWHEGRHNGNLPLKDIFLPKDRVKI